MVNKYKVGVFGIINDKENKVLLCHRRDYDLWNLPGGGLENNESPWDGVVREIREETGLNVKVSKITGIYFKPEKQEIIFNFKCETIDGKITLNDEADKIKYFKLNNIPKNTSPKQVERINDYFKEKNKLLFKVQKGKSSIELIKEGKL